MQGVANARAGGGPPLADSRVIFDINEWQDRPPERIFAAAGFGRKQNKIVLMPFKSLGNQMMLFDLFVFGQLVCFGQY